MSVLISDNDYKEYRGLQDHYKREQNLQSINLMKTLEDDIDTPIKTIVGMFALLGCEPLFSCCGFDYHGQPLHKTHEYGNAYVILSDNENTNRIIRFFVELGNILDSQEKTSQWRTWKVEHSNPKPIFVALAFDWEDSERDYPWTKHNCIHYAEKAVIGLSRLRKWLFGFRPFFLDSTTLKDTNRNYSHLSYWQYPALENWVITREELLKNLESEGME